MHILLIEDNPTIAQNIITYLEFEGRTTDHYTDGDDGLQAAQQHTYDCIILDVMLPHTDGFTILKHIRKTKQTPVIFTTAKSQLDDKTMGFDAGADDYLVKPFELAELVLRIRAITKHSQTQDIRRRQNIEINLDTNEINHNGIPITLTPKERHILVLLIDANGHIVQRTTIIDELRGDTGIRDASNDSKLDVYISNLRKKLDKKLIQTVKSVGYRIVCTD